MSNTNREVVHDGWLIKSPPTKRIWRARWRRRWFILRHSGELPGQFFLEYYTDRNCRKLKGIIDLDQCEQVDAGLLFEQRKFKYPYMFDVKTPSRVYYLAAETEQDMNNWVDSICQVCGLKAYSSEEQTMQSSENESHDMNDFKMYNFVPNTVPLPPVSGPYIPISECITGRPLTAPIGEQECRKSSVSIPSNLTETGTDTSTTQKRKIQPFSLSSIDITDNPDQKYYDLPRNLHTTRRIPKWSDANLVDRDGSPPLQSPTDSESVFTDDEWSHPVYPSVNGLKESRPSNSSVEMESAWSVVHRFGKLTVVDTEPTDHLEEVPPRPPKPTTLEHSPNYLNLKHPSKLLKKTYKETIEMSGDLSNPVVHDIQPPVDTNDEMYDFPRSHNIENEISKHILPNRHCYNNAAPSCVEGHIFRYDLPAENIITQSLNDEEPASPCSQSSSSTTAYYSNLPSPLLPDIQSIAEPPVVNRCLKPGRKNSDSASIYSLQEPSSPDLAPNVDRKLKPNTQRLPQKSNEIEEPSASISRSQRIGPNPTSPCFSNENEDIDEQIYNQLATSHDNRDFDKLQYLDLDLDSESYNVSLNLSQPVKSSNPITVYKTVDFVKTEAFKRTRQCVEAARKKCSVQP